MLVVSLCFISIFLGVTGSVCNKLCSNYVGYNSKENFPFFVALNGFTACIFFWIMSSFDLKANLITILFAFIYAVVVIASLMVNLYSLHIANISSIKMIGSAIGLITSTLIGKWFFGECIEYRNILQIVIMISAIILILIGMKKETVKRKDSKITLVFVIFANLILSSLGNITLKKYTLLHNVKSNNVLFFYTNLITIVIAVFWLYIAKKGEINIRNYFVAFKPTNVLSTICNTISSNFTSLIKIVLIARLKLSIYTALMSAIGILTGIVASVIFKEKISKWQIIAALCAFLATIV